MGYLLALGGTSVGQGWRLLAHLAHAHVPVPLRAPEVYPEGPAPPPAMTTLRQVPTRRHAHDGHSHLHEHALEGHRHEAPPGSPRARNAVRASHETPDASQDAHGRPGVHEHGGQFHTHHTPPPEPGLVLTFSLDEHRLLSAPALPLPPLPRRLDFARPEAAPLAVHHPVETPPPLARG